MRYTDLPDPGEFSTAQRVRMICARAISHAENNPSPDYSDLRAFFLACAAAVPVTGDGPPPGVFNTGVWLDGRPWDDTHIWRDN